MHVRPSQEELALRDWPIHWVSRGGGAMLHQPGQVTCYPVFALDRMNQTPAVILNIQRQPGANIIDVVDRVKKLLPQLRTSLPFAAVTDQR